MMALFKGDGGKAKNDDFIKKKIYQIIGNHSQSTLVNSQDFARVPPDKFWILRSGSNVPGKCLVKCSLVGLLCMNYMSLKY